jgi:TetR/AcrR family transcriptional repressor of lmrAB and yxaGH operons
MDGKKGQTHNKANGGLSDNRSSRERIIHAASNLFESNGYHGTGLNEIVRKAKAPKGSIYYYFPGGKEQIAMETILLAGRSFAEKIRLGLMQKQNASKGIRTFVNTLSLLLIASGYRSGGPLTLIASESATTNKRLNGACREAYALMRKAFKEMLSAYGIPSANASKLSVFITAAIEGGVILSRTYHSSKPLRTMALFLGDMIQTMDRSQSTAEESLLSE